jgi:DNA-directed RNA polymerase specialized sigma subunit
MLLIVKKDVEEVEAQEDYLEELRRQTISSPNMDGMPHAHNPAAAEDRIVNGIDEIDILKERYRQAVEYMSWFKPAWEQLTEDERYILESFYGSEGSYGSNTVSYIAEYLGVEQTTAYKRKNRALDRLTVLLFGKV